MLKQGGNWIGNTGYGYGDSDLIGYSERLALLFTDAIGRDIKVGSTYVGAPIGDSLARAKRLYVKTAGPGSFSVFDEKVIEELTLYGLPFVNVRVPKPVIPRFGGGTLFDPPPTPFPTNQQNNNGVITRVITFTNNFVINDFGLDHTPRVFSQVQDSFVPGPPQFLNGDDQSLLGRPVLPILSYDVTLKPNGGAGRIPEPRGVRLLSATTLPDLGSFNPHVTMPITDQVYPQQKDDPSMPLAIQGAWQPEQPFSFQRTAQHISATAVVTADKLLVNPAQFRPTSIETGLLRRFGQMVFEISYLDPSRANLNILQDDVPPVIEDVTITATAAQSVRVASTQMIHINVTILDNNTLNGMVVTAIYTTDGSHWDDVTFTQNGSIFSADVQTQPLGPDVVAIIQARDRAGNVVVETHKGILSSEFTSLFLPFVYR